MSDRLIVYAAVDDDGDEPRTVELFSTRAAAERFVDELRKTGSSCSVAERPLDTPHGLTATARQYHRHWTHLLTGETQHSTGYSFATPDAHKLPASTQLPQLIEEALRLGRFRVRAEFYDWDFDRAALRCFKARMDLREFFPVQRLVPYLTCADLCHFVPPHLPLEETLDWERRLAESGIPELRQEYLLWLEKHNWPERKTQLRREIGPALPKAHWTAEAPIGVLTNPVLSTCGAIAAFHRLEKSAIGGVK